MIGPSKQSALVYRARPFKQVVARSKRFATTDQPVLLLGEPGTGKELLARYVHEQSPRKRKPWVPVNCAELPDNLADAELFGHEKGAFTGANRKRIGLIASADGGTVFLDEIGDLPLQTQAKLLRFIQEGEVRAVGSDMAKQVGVRVVAATNRDIESMVAGGEFRNDLFDRLAVHVVRVPPLRERGEDVLVIADAFLEQYGQEGQSFSDTARAVLLRHDWPGNVRELHSVVRSVVALTTAKSIEAQHLESLVPGAENPLPLREVRVFKILKTLLAAGNPTIDDLVEVRQADLRKDLGMPDGSLRDVLGGLVDDKTLLRLEPNDAKLPFYKVNPDFLVALRDHFARHQKVEVMNATGHWVDFADLADLELVQPPGPNTLRVRYDWDREE